MINFLAHLHVLLPLSIAFFSTIILTYLLLPLIKKMGLMDDPKIHLHPGIIHKKPIPRGGGIPLFLGVFFTSLIFLPWNPTISAVFFAACLALGIGVIDDKLNAAARDVSPYLRFLINILCAVIVVGSGVSISFITNPLTGGILPLDTIRFSLWNLGYISAAQIISILWIIWVMNILNWSKGVDGQMPGIVAISSIFIGILSLRLTTLMQPTLIDAQLAFIIAGASLGFLIFNYYPAKIFPGYGATAIYLLLAVVSILSSAKLATAILVMGVPTVDALFTIARRLLARKSPFLGDKRHLHHLLLDLGYSQRQVALFYWTISALLGIISLTLKSTNKLFAIIMLVVIVGGALLFLHYITKQSDEKTTS